MLIFTYTSMQKQHIKILPLLIRVPRAMSDEYEYMYEYSGALDECVECAGPLDCWSASRSAVRGPAAPRSQWSKRARRRTAATLSLCSALDRSVRAAPVLFMRVMNVCLCGGGPAPPIAQNRATPCCTRAASKLRLESSFSVYACTIESENSVGGG